MVHHLTLAILIPSTLLLAAQWNRLEITAGLWALAMVALEIVWVPHLLRNAMPSPATMVNVTAGFGILASAVVPSLWLVVAVATAVATGVLLAANFRMAAATEAVALVAILAIALAPEGSPPFPPIWMLVVLGSLAVADTFGWLLTYDRWNATRLNEELVASDATVWEVSRSGRINKLVGAGLGDIAVGESLAKMVHPNDIDLVRSNAAPAFGGSVDFRLRDGDGGWLWVREVPLQSLGSDGTRRSRVTDTSIERSRTEELQGMATSDPLTQCANRSAHEAELASRSRAKQLSLIKIELDGLDRVIDTLGYETADRVLAACADRIRVQSQGHHLARVGTDQFAVITDLNENEVTELARRIREQIVAPFSIGGAQATVRARIGTATSVATRPPSLESRPADGPERIPAPELATISHRADQAARRARSENSGVASYVSSSDGASAETTDLARRVIDAFRQDEFGVHHQPVFVLPGTASTDKAPVLTGTEALARWFHPEAGVLEPARFLSILSVGGHQRRLFRTVLDNALNDFGAGPRSGDRFVAINLDADVLDQMNVASVAGELLGRHGVGPNRLIVDISAAELVALDANGRRALANLADLGVRICADRLDITEVGLGILADLPISEVKISATVLVEAADDPGLRSLVDAAIAGARQLGWVVSAVGVETASDLELIRELGCDRVQGHLLGHAMSITELAEAGADDSESDSESEATSTAEDKTEDQRTETSSTSGRSRRSRKKAAA